MQQNLQAALGTALLLVAVGGPFTFADDLRHEGELAVVVAALLSGVCLLAPALLPHRCWSSSLPVASVFVLLGLSAGTLTDRPSLGLLLGAALGLLAVAWLTARSSHRPPR